MKLSEIPVTPEDIFLQSVIDASNKDAELDERQLGWLMSVSLGTQTSGIRKYSPEWRQEVTATATWINSCHQ